MSGNIIDRAVPAQQDLPQLNNQNNSTRPLNNAENNVDHIARDLIINGNVDRGKDHIVEKLSNRAPFTTNLTTILRTEFGITPDLMIDLSTRELQNLITARREGINQNRENAIKQQRLQPAIDRYTDIVYDDTLTPEQHAAGLKDLSNELRMNGIRGEVGIRGALNGKLGIEGDELNSLVNEISDLQFDIAQEISEDLNYNDFFEAFHNQEVKQRDYDNNGGSLAELQEANTMLDKAYNDLAEKMIENEITPNNFHQMLIDISEDGDPQILGHVETKEQLQRRIDNIKENAAKEERIQPAINEYNNVVRDINKTPEERTAALKTLSNALMENGIVQEEDIANFLDNKIDLTGNDNLNHLVDKVLEKQTKIGAEQRLERSAPARNLRKYVNILPHAGTFINLSKTVDRLVAANAHPDDIANAQEERNTARQVLAENMSQNGIDIAELQELLRNGDEIPHEDLNIIANIAPELQRDFDVAETTRVRGQQDTEAAEFRATLPNVEKLDRKADAFANALREDPESAETKSAAAALAKEMKKQKVNLDDIDKVINGSGLDEDKQTRLKQDDAKEILKTEYNKVDEQKKTDTSSRIKKGLIITAAIVGSVAFAAIGVGLLAGGIGVMIGVPFAAPLGVALMIISTAAFTMSIGTLGIGAFAFVDTKENDFERNAQRNAPPQPNQTLPNTNPQNPQNTGGVVSNAAIEGHDARLNIHNRELQLLNEQKGRLTDNQRRLAEAQPPDQEAINNNQNLISQNQNAIAQRQREIDAIKLDRDKEVKKETAIRGSKAAFPAHLPNGSVDPELESLSNERARIKGLMATFPDDPSVLPQAEHNEYQRLDRSLNEYTRQYIDRKANLTGRANLNVERDLTPEQIQQAENEANARRLEMGNPL